MSTNTTIPAFNFSNVQESLALATIIFAGHIGFTLLQLGLCQPKNSSSIIINNFTSIGLGAISYWATGYAFALGRASNAVLSYSQFFMIDAITHELVTWYWHCSQATLFIVIANGGFVERMKGKVYPVFAILFAGFFFSVASHWSWHRLGWLYNTLDNTIKTMQIRLIDNGGVGCLHVSAGSIALIGGIFLQPRKNRKKDERFQFVGGQTNINIFLGGFLAMISLLARNSALYFSNMALMNSLLASATSSITAIMFKRSDLFGENWNVKTLINGAITGLVAVSAAPHTYRPYGSLAIGLIAGISYNGWSVTLRKFRFDDVVDTVAIHLGGGIWGLMAGAFFNQSIGVFYTGTTNSFKLFGWNLLAIVVYFAWHSIATCVVFLPFQYANALRYSKSEVNNKGIDMVVHQEPAYPSKDTYHDSKKKEQKKLPIWSTVHRSQHESTKPDRTDFSYENYPYYIDIHDDSTQQTNNNAELTSWSP